MIDLDAVRARIDRQRKILSPYVIQGQAAGHAGDELAGIADGLLAELVQARIDRDERLTLAESSRLARMLDEAPEPGEIAQLRDELEQARAEVERAERESLDARTDAGKLRRELDEARLTIRAFVGTNQGGTE